MGDYIAASVASSYQVLAMCLLNPSTPQTSLRKLWPLQAGFTSTSGKDSFKFPHSLRLRGPLSRREHNIDLNEFSPFSHCSDENTEMRDFYKALLYKFSMRKILTSLARLSLTSIDSGLEKLISSRVILAKILQDPHFGMKDYISWTTKLSEFQKENGLVKFYSEPEEKPGF